MKGMILAAGLGKRLRPLTENQAKPALPVVNIPLIYFALQLLQSAGIREVIVNLHHEPESIKRILGSGRKFKMKIQYSMEPEILGTGGGIKKVEDFFRGEPFVVVNGDIICELDLKRAIHFHRERDALATMVVRPDKSVEKYGIIGLDPQQRIRRFTNLVKAPEKFKEVTKTMFTGIHIFSPAIFEYIPPAIECCVNQYSYPRMLENDEPVFGFITHQYWSDLGTIDSYFQANLDFLKDPDLLSYYDPLGDYEYAPKREVDRVIRMGKKVNLMEGAKIIDPVVIGDHCRIGKGSVIGPHVILGKECDIGEGNRLEECILYSGSKTLDNEIIRKEIRVKKLQVSVGAGGKEGKLAPLSA